MRWVVSVCLMLCAPAFAGGGSFAGGFFDGYMRAEENRRQNMEADQRAIASEQQRQAHQIQIEQMKLQQERQSLDRMRLQMTRQSIQDARASDVVFNSSGKNVTSGEVFSFVQNLCAKSSSDNNLPQEKSGYLCHCIAFKTATAVSPTKSGGVPVYDQQALTRALESASGECRSEI